MENLKLDDNGNVIFNSKDCMLFDKSSPYTLLDTESHAYLVVNMKDIFNLGIEQGISEYSFTNGPEVWLEEDCDALLFIKAYVEYNKEPFPYGQDYATYEEWEDLRENCLERYDVSKHATLTPIADIWKSDRLFNQDAINNLSVDQLEMVSNILDKVK